MFAIWAENDNFFFAKKKMVVRCTLIQLLVSSEQFLKPSRETNMNSRIKEFKKSKEKLQCSTKS